VACFNNPRSTSPHIGANGRLPISSYGQKRWRRSSMRPAWLTEEVCSREIHPPLKTITLSVLASNLGISIPHAVDIRAAEEGSASETLAYSRATDLPDWLNEKLYIQEIQPRLKAITLSVLASKLSISIPYAVDIRSGRRVPHPRHWQTLAQLVGVSSTSEFPILHSN
jgi:hypothetical protein